MARKASEASNDSSTRVGVVFFRNDKAVWSGFNTFPDRVAQTPERWAAPAKDAFVQHAETFAICSAAAAGVKLQHTTIAITHSPCLDCARNLITAGVRRVITTPVAPDTRWTLSQRNALRLFEEAGVEVVVVSF